MYTVGIENSLHKILQHNLVFKEHPKLYQNYYFITDLLIFTSLTRHIQWIMICLLKLSGVGQSLLLLHALIAFRFILNKSWDRQKCVSILGMDFVKCFMLLFEIRRNQRVSIPLFISCFASCKYMIRVPK